MKTKDAVQFYGGRRAVAEAIGISVQSVAQWRERVPLGSAYKLQVATKGKLLVNISMYRKKNEI
jgi:DNA-binding transcriptional regulator YdaS (Cro superfamily)